MATIDELTAQIDATYAEVNRLSAELRNNGGHKRMSWGRIENINRLKDKAAKLIAERKMMYAKNKTATDF